MSRRRAAPRLLAALGGCWLVGMTASAQAQTSWDATLLVAPFPSPYLSDWETNPTIATYTLINGTDREQAVVLHYEVRDQSGRVVTAGRSDPQPIAPGVPAVYTSFTDIAGSTEHDPTLEDQVTRSGRMPEGDYTACVVAVSTSGFVLARACETFTVVYPDPPMLIAPADGDVVETTAPIFQWSPLQVPADFTLHFVLQMAELRPGQTPYTALTSNILHYENLDVGATSFAYPVDGLPLTGGKTYAWRVVALDQNGYAAATNGGSSEIWTFRYDDGTTTDPPAGPRASAAFTLQVRESPVPDEGDNAGVYVADTDAALAALCATSDQWASGVVDSTLDFEVRAPFFKNDTVPVTVYYAVDTLGFQVSQQWAVHGASQTRNWEYFVRGDCDGGRNETGARTHWMAIRQKRSLGSFSFRDFLEEAFHRNQGSDPVDRPTSNPSHEGFELAFGAGILAWRPATVGDDQLFPAEADFFDGNEFDVLPGLNAYGVIWLPEGGLWGWLRQWGYSENKLELQGFVGMATSVTAGLEVGSDGKEVDVSLQQKFLVLSIKLPKRTPQHISWIRSMQPGFQFSIEDTLTTGVGSGAETKAGLDFILKFVWTWEINDDVSLVWTGGLDRNLEYERGKGGSAKTVLVLSGECQCVWKSPFNVGDWWIGNPKLELQYNLTTRAELSVAGSFQTGWGEAPPIAIGGSLKWEKKLIVPPEFQHLKTEADKAWTKYMDALTAFKALPEPDDPAEFQRRKLDGILDEDELAWDRAQRAKDRAREEHAAAEAKLTEALKSKPDAVTRKEFDWRHPEWRVRAAAGNVGFKDLIDFFRSLW